MEPFYNDVERTPKAEIKSTCLAVRDYTPQRQNRGYMEDMMTFKGDKFRILNNSSEFGLWLVRSKSTNRKDWIPSSYAMPGTEW